MTGAEINAKRASVVGFMHVASKFIPLFNTLERVSSMQGYRTTYMFWKFGCFWY